MTSVAYLCRAPWTEGPDIHRSCCPMVKFYFELQHPEAPRLHGSKTQRPHKTATDKQPRGSPTGEVPLQTSKQRPVVSSSQSGVCRSLFSPWTDAEESAL